jgi:hypothetical protein
MALWQQATPVHDPGMAYCNGLHMDMQPLT